MIRYLQKLKAKKGFTLIELIIVMAIIAILIAMTLPAFSNDDAKRMAVNTYASDFYSGLQYNLTRYQKTEAPVSPALAADTNSYLKYDASAGQNILTEKYLYIEACYDRGLKYVNVADRLAALTGVTPTVSDTAFEQQLQNDMEDVINRAEDGYYYALISMEGNYNTIRAVTVHYTEERITDPTPAQLVFVDNSELENGLYCGTCTSDNKKGSYVGTIGTQFLNVSDATNTSPYANNAA